MRSATCSPWCSNPSAAVLRVARALGQRRGPPARGAARSRRGQRDGRAGRRTAARRRGGAVRAAGAPGAPGRPRLGADRCARRTRFRGAPGEDPRRGGRAAPARSADGCGDRRHAQCARRHAARPRSTRGARAGTAATRRLRPAGRALGWGAAVGRRWWSARDVDACRRRRARRARRQEGAHRGQPAPGGEHRQEVHQSRPAAARSDSGRQHRPDARGGQVRVPARIQVLDLRDVVDPPGDGAPSPIDRAPSAFPCT